MNAKHPPLKPKVANGSPQGSVASRIKNLQQTFSGGTSTSGSDDASDPGEQLYAQVIKPKPKDNAVKPRPHQDNKGQIKGQTKQWPPPKPNIPPKSSSVAEPMANKLSTSVLGLGSVDKHPSKVIEKFANVTNSHENGPSGKYGTPKIGGSPPNRVTKKIATPPPMPPSKANRSNLFKTNSATSDHADENKKANDVTQRAPWLAITKTSPAPLHSKVNNGMKLKHSSSSASESSEDGKSTVKTTPFKASTQSPMLPSKFNRPKLPIKTNHLVDEHEDSVDGHEHTEGSPTWKSPAPQSPPKPPAKLSYSSSSASECSEDGRGEGLIRSTSNEPTPRKALVHKLVAKMKTPPPMVPPNMKQLKLVNLEDSGKDHSVLTKTTSTDKQPTSTKPKPPLLPSKVNRPCLHQQQSQVDPGDMDEDNDDLVSTKSSVDRLGLDGVSTPVSPLRRSKALFHSADNLDAADQDPREEKSKGFLRKQMTFGGLRNDNNATESDKKDKEPKKRISLSLQGVKPLSVLKKYLGGTTDSDKSETKPETDKGREGKRWSVGDGFKANLASISNIFKQKKTDEDSSTSAKRLSKDNISTPSNNIPIHVSDHVSSLSEKKPLNLSQSVPLMSSLGDNAEGGSAYENISFCAPYRGDDNDADDDDDFDEDDEWDDDEFSEDEEDQVQSLKCKALSYESYDRESHLLLIEKRRQVVEELVSTETSYVNKLYMLNKTAWEVGGANLALDMFHPSKVHHMFPSIEALYRLHGENILPAMKITLENWSGTPELYPMWKKYLPFLTMYKSYTSQYDGALDVINQYKKSSPEFATVLTKLEERAEFGKFTLEHHLIEPIQRIGRYKLLLQNYGKLLMEGEDETSQMTGVIQSIEQLLQDCQNQLRKQDNFGDLYKIQERFEDTLTLLSPTSQLLKEGQMVQISGSNKKKKTQRHIFLFSDSVLICTKRPSGKFRIIYQMELAELKIRPVDAACAPIYGTEKTMMLRDGDCSVNVLYKADDIKADWEEAILDAITVKLMQGQLRRCGNTDAHTDVHDDCVSCQGEPREESNHGDVNFNKVPEWRDDDAITSCMSCENKFISVLRKKNHCRGCGWVICGSCCRQKMALPCMNGEICRVCNLCFIRARRSYAHLTRRISTVALPKFKSRTTVKSRDNNSRLSTLNLEIVHGLPWLEEEPCGSSEA